MSSSIRLFCGSAIWLSRLSRKSYLQRIKWYSTVSSDVGVMITSIKSKRIITLNRPRVLNVLNLSMVRLLYPLLKEWDKDKSVSVVIIKGAGEKAFCAGGDVVAVTKSALSNDPTQTIHKDFFREEYMLNHAIGTFSKPYIALLNGITMGGGCGLSIHGQFRIATEKTILAMPETALGLFPDVGGSYFLSRLPNMLGQFLALTGYRLQGADVFHSGLATHFVNSASLAQLESELIDIPEGIVSFSSIDAVIKKFHEKKLPPFSLEPHWEEIKFIFGAPRLDDVMQRLRECNSEFSKKQLEVLSKMSPTSIKLTFKQIKQGEKMDFSSVFTMEYRLTQRLMERNDFHEGCRAILIEKDRNPMWKPAKIEDVADEDIESYFAPLPNNMDLFIQ